MENQEFKVFILYNSNENKVIGRFVEDSQEVICMVDSILVTDDEKYKPKWYLKPMTAQKTLDKFSDGLDMSDFEIIELSVIDKPNNETVRNAFNDFLNNK